MPPFGFIFGIIGELYFKLNTILFLFVGIFILYFVLKKNQKRYLKVICKKSAILLFLASACISFLYVKNENNKYTSIIEKNMTELVGTIKSDAQENEYTYCYTFEAENLQGIKKVKLKLYIKKSKKQRIFKYGDKIYFTGELTKPNISRNFGGFNLDLYYKTQKLYGNIYTNNAKKISESFDIGQISNKIKGNIENTYKKKMQVCYLEF